MLSEFTIHRLFTRIIWLLLIGLLPLACVDPEDTVLRGTVDVVVVDGTINNLPEPQLIQLNRSRADPLTGRFGVLPITKAQVEVVVDSAEVIACHETVDGTYGLPSDFRGQVGHSYQLRFTLTNGTRYVSNQQVMPVVPPINRITGHFNPKSLPPGLLNGFTSGFDMFIDTQDSPGQRNYYRWDWILYERQYWCRTCTQGNYMTNRLTLVSSYPLPLVYKAEPQLLEDCFSEPPAKLRDGSDAATPYFFYDYSCRTSCWEIVRGYTLNLFDDRFSDGGLISGRTVAQVPYYTQNPALIEIRQGSLTPDAYQFFTLFQQQTQNTGGLADTPPAALVGNVRNAANPRENVVGFFTAGAVSSVRYWIDKKDADPYAYGAYDQQGNIVPGDQQLFYALNRRQPHPEEQQQQVGLGYTIIGGGSRPPTAVCGPLDQRTPVKPTGWRD